MSQKYIDFPIQEVLNLKGMVVDSIDLSNKDKIITIHLKRDLRFSLSYCSKCGCVAPRNRRVIKVVRDLPIYR